MAEKKLNRNQIEELEHAMDYIHDVMMEIEDKKGCKRIWKKLDVAIGNLYDVIQR